MSAAVPRSAAGAPEFVKIPGGTFVMGDVWRDGLPDEQPARETEVASFLLGACAVSCRQFVGFANDPSSCLGGRSGAIDVHGETSPFAWEGGRYWCRDGCEERPATCIDWAAARAYCRWLGQRVGADVRLPSEVEWQYASGGPQRFKWTLGNTFRRDHYVCGCAGPQPADWGEPSAWGLLNMTGNVFEWTADEYRFSYHTDAQRLPGNRVIKGGAFILSESVNLRNSRRFSCDERSCLSSIGFRVACSIDGRGASMPVPS